ncbi:hypothetical protein ACSBR2_040592 [Camellia fascicularis]
MGKSKVLVVGGTGYIGSKIVRESLAQGHTTFVLQRPDMDMDVNKLQMLLSFKASGAQLVEGSFSDHQSLVDALKLVDVVICATSGLHFPTHTILLQLKLVEAIKEAGNIKRFLPSEFGMDPSRMEHAKEPGNVTFVDKMRVRKAIEEAQIPYTYVSANCYGAYFAGNLSQLGMLLPPKEKVSLFGDGDVKGMDYGGQVAASHCYHTFYEGCLTNFEIGEEGEEASNLYPEVDYTRMDTYLKRYL